MRLFLISCLLLVCSKWTRHAGCSSTHKPQDDQEQDASGNYTTKELRDACLKEWGGRTQEVQAYFDQLPSEEFKENSEDLKFQFYYERKGIEDVDSNVIYNVTPKVWVPPGPEYTVEVNDSYVPKYRPTTSEEIRMENDGTFNSPSSSESSTEDVPTTKLPGPGSERPGGKKRKKGKKRWPTNMNPIEKPKKKKKKKKIDTEDTKRKETLAKTINGLNRPYTKKNDVPNKKTNTVENRDHNKMNPVNANLKILRNVNFREIGGLGKKINERSQKENIKLQQSPTTTNVKRKIKTVSIFNKFMGVCKLRHKHQHNEQKYKRPRQRRNEQPRPFL